MKKLDLDFMSRIKGNLRGYKGNLGRLVEGLDLPLVDKRMMPPTPLLSSNDLGGTLARMASSGIVPMTPGAIAAGVPCPALSWDVENSDSVIAPGGSANIYVVGGSSPYTWRLPPGSSFSLGNEQTTGLGNVLTGNGSCDSVIVTVNDFCDLECSGTVAPDIDTFTYDAGNPTTIAAGSGGITITVTGGVGPFTWEIDAYGPSFAAGETEGRTNTLTSIDCTNGNEGTITVTDACGVEVEGSMEQLEGTGEWVCQAYANYSGNPASDLCVGPQGAGGGCTDPDHYYEYSGNERWWLQSNSCFSRKTADPCPIDTCTWEQVTPSSCLDLAWKNPPCGSPAGCAPTSCTEGCAGYIPSFCAGCIMTAAYYYKWECP